MIHNIFRGIINFHLIEDFESILDKEAPIVVTFPIYTIIHITIEDKILHKHFSTNSVTNPLKRNIAIITMRELKGHLK